MITEMCYFSVNRYSQGIMNCRVCYAVVYTQENQNLQHKNKALEMKLRQINLQLTEVAKVYPNVAALLNYNTSINASTTVASRASEISTKADDVKDVDEPPDSEGSTIHTICTTIVY